jgi:serine/threonine protein phosphatase PrpC
MQRPEEAKQGYQGRRLHSDNVVHSDEYEDLPDGLEIYGTFADDFDEDEDEEKQADIEKVNTRPPGESLEEESQRASLEEESRLRLVVGLGSDPGVTRKNAPNEDNVLGLQGTHVTGLGAVPVGLFVVADGMGGHSNGQEASRIAIRSMSDVVAPALLNSKAAEELCEGLLKDGAQHANFAIYQRNQQNFMMGTTLTSALIFGSTAHIINIGDSRTYLYRASSGLTQVTRDHSHVWQLFEAGIIKHEDIYTHPERNQIARCLGEHVRAEIDSFKVSLQADDVLLLCSDGLWEMVRDPEIEQIIQSNASHAPQVSAKLIEAALRNGGADNVSAVAVCVVA